LIIDKDSDGYTRIISSGKTDLLKPSSKSILIKLQMSNPEIFTVESNNVKNYTYSYGSRAILHFFSDRFFSQPSTINPREMTSYDLKKELNKVREKNKDKRNYELTVYEIEYYKKFSLPFGAFFFSLLALPLALLFGKHNGQTIGLIIGVLLSVLYWALLIMGQTYGAQTNTNGFLVMWLPNTIMGIMAFILFFRLVKK
jgi:lipopolysaccharide export system permease protein